MREATRNKIGKAMAIVLFEKNKGEVLTVATIRDELGSRFQITGMGSAEASSDLALLLRAGSLAAPMEIIEERTIGPQLGADNIEKGINSTLYGFAAIAIFMVIYYMLFGFFSVFALAVNLMLLVALLSVMQATLTLPGIAAIAFTLFTSPPMRTRFPWRASATSPHGMVWSLNRTAKFAYGCEDTKSPNDSFSHISICAVEAMGVSRRANTACVGEAANKLSCFCALACCASL